MKTITGTRFELKKLAMAIALASFAQVAMSQTALVMPVKPSAATKRLTREQMANLSPSEVTQQRFLQFLRSNPEIQSAVINLQATDFGKDAAKAGFYPRVSIGANANSSSNPDLNNRQSTDITVRQPLYTAGRLTARVNAAESDTIIAKGTYDKTVQDSVLDALIAHTQLVRMDLLVAASRGGVQAVSDLYELEQRRVDLGGGGVTDAQFAKARLSVAQDRLASFEGQLEEARASFFRYFASYPEGSSIPELDVPDKLLPGNVEKAVSNALVLNPQIKVAENQIVRAKYNYEAESASLWPTLEAVGVQQYYGEADPISGKRSNTSLNLRLAYSAFSGGEQQARVGQAAATIESQRALMTSSRLRTEEGVRFQWGRRAAAMSRAVALDDAARDALNVFKNRKKLRDFGRETAIAMLDAQVEYFNVLVAYLNAAFDARTASIRLLHAMGQLQPPAEDPGAWLTQFFTQRSERQKLEKNLLLTQEISRGKTTSDSATDLGIKVDTRTAERAEQFSLTPESRISRKPRKPEALPDNSQDEKLSKPALKPSMEFGTQRF